MLINLNKEWDDSHSPYEQMNENSPADFIYTRTSFYFSKRHKTSFKDTPIPFTSRSELISNRYRKGIHDMTVVWILIFHRRCDISSVCKACHFTYLSLISSPYRLNHVTLCPALWPLRTNAYGRTCCPTSVTPVTSPVTTPASSRRRDTAAGTGVRSPEIKWP